MSDFEYFICEFIYEAAIHSPKQHKIRKQDIVEMQYLLAKEDVRRMKLEQGWN